MYLYFNKKILFSFSVLLVAVLPILLPPILFHWLYRVIYYFILNFYYKFIMEQEKHKKLLHFLIVKTLSAPFLEVIELAGSW